MGKRQTLNLLLEIFVPTILEINVFYNSAYSRGESDKSIFEKKIIIEHLPNLEHFENAIRKHCTCMTPLV